LQLLLELNPDVSGTSGEGFLKEENIGKFSLIIATELNDTEMQRISRICEKK